MRLFEAHAHPAICSFFPTAVGNIGDTTFGQPSCSVKTEKGEHAQWANAGQNLEKATDLPYSG
jgi:hypothetical protein